MADERIQLTVKMLVMVVVVVGLAGSTTSLSPLSKHLASSPVDTSLCTPTDTLALCELKLAECSGVSHLLTPPSGLTHQALLCANTTNTPLTHSFLAILRMAVLQGKPSDFFNSAVTSPSLRQCVVNATGFLDPQTLTLNRTTVASRVQELLPDMPALIAAAETCPEPLDFDGTSFLSCLERACMANVAQSPEMTMAQPLLKPPASSNSASKPPAAILPFFVP